MKSSLWSTLQLDSNLSLYSVENYRTFFKVYSLLFWRGKLLKTRYKARWTIPYQGTCSAPWTILTSWTRPQMPPGLITNRLLNKDQNYNGFRQNSFDLNMLGKINLSLTDQRKGNNLKFHFRQGYFPVKNRTAIKIIYRFFPQMCDAKSVQNFP